MVVVAGRNAAAKLAKSLAEVDTELGALAVAQQNQA